MLNLKEEKSIEQKAYELINGLDNQLAELKNGVNIQTVELKKIMIYLEKGDYSKTVKEFMHEDLKHLENENRCQAYMTLQSVINCREKNIQKLMQLQGIKDKSNPHKKPIKKEGEEKKDAQ